MDRYTEVGCSNICSARFVYLKEIFYFLQNTSGKTKERLEEVRKNVQDIKQKIKDGENEIPNLDQQTVDLKEKKNLVRLLIFLHGTLTTDNEQYVV